MTSAQGQPERRRVPRIALRLNATARERGRNRVPVRIVDISTHGCRIEMMGGAFVGESIWLSIAGLETQQSRIAWHHDGFAGLEFSMPLSEAVLDSLVAAHKVASEAIVHELRQLASRTHRLCAQSRDRARTADLMQFSRDCAVQAIVQGLKLGEATAAEPEGPRLTSAMIRRGGQDGQNGPGFSFDLAGGAP